tara:strand:- start:3645 stop:4877 length:1233 start_codon:yes stop_codon:yes gene_type:complete
MSTTRSNKLLLLTYAFSPLQAPEAFLAAKSLSKINKYKVDVLTLDYCDLGISIDTSLNNYVKENFGKIYRIKPPSWINKKSFNFIRYISHFPDKFSVFNNLIIKKAIAINVYEYDAIITWSQSHSIHLAALKIKNKFPNLPWIAHLSDPWADNPFLLRYFGYRTIQKPLEKKVIKNANALNFTTNLTRMMVMKKYPKDWINKTYVTPHSYDLSLYDSNNKKNDDKFKIAYFGNFYGPRNPMNFLHALEDIYNRDNNFFQNIFFEFIGKWVGNENWNIGDLNLPRDLVIYEKPVSYLESLKRMLNADMLLILDAPFDISVFFPSKLVDYIGAQKPILAITPEGSCADIVREVGGLVYSPDTIESVQNGIISAISSLRSGPRLSMLNSDMTHFSNDFVSKQYQLLIDQVVHN